LVQQMAEPMAGQMVQWMVVRLAHTTAEHWAGKTVVQSVATMVLKTVERWVGQRAQRLELWWA
jgi:hypothetical protein